MRRSLPFFLVTFSFFLFLGRIFIVQAASSDDGPKNFQQRDPKIYNYLPLVLNDTYSIGNTGAMPDIISYQMAFNQGYEVQCAKPRWFLAGQVHGDIEEYFEEYTKPVRLTAESVYAGEFAEAKIPLFQGSEDIPDTTKISSYEGYFGANYQKDKPVTLNSGGVATTLLTREAQCKVKFENLKSQYGMGKFFCEKFLDPGAPCYVNQVQIPDTDYGGWVLFLRMAGMFEKTSNTEPPRNFSCNDLMGSWDPSLEADFGITFDQFESTVRPLGEAVAHSELNPGALYRLAFLVISIKQNVMDGNEEVNPGLFESNEDIFDYLEIVTPLPDGATFERMPVKHEAPMVIGFKVPVTATNAIFSEPYFMDTARLTAYMFTEKDNIERHFEEMKKQRTKYVGDILYQKEFKPIINCGGLPQCLGGDPETQLLLSLIDQINGSGLDCGGFEGVYENVTELGSRAEVNEDNAREFKPPFFSRTFPSDNKYTFDWNIIVKDVNVNGDLDGDQIKIRGHLVTPYGADMEYVNKTLQQIFTKDEFKKIVENNCVPDFGGKCGVIPEYLTFIDSVAEHRSKTDTFKFIYHQPPGCIEHCPKDSEDWCIECERKSFVGVTVEFPQVDMRILGGELGWTIRKIQETLRDFGSKAHDYIASCERTEDMFLGRCKGYPDKDPSEDDDFSEKSCAETQAQKVKLPTMNELMKMTCSIAGNDPNDAQLLWGLMQIEGSPFLREIVAGKSEMSCADILTNSCGASQIMGVLIPQCIDKAGCPQAAYIADDTKDPWIQEARNNPKIACDIATSMEYILRKRKSEKSWLVEQYQAANGSAPSTEQLYYMMAGRNYGLPTTSLVQPACGNEFAVDGCGGANYCVCTMDTFPFSCGG